MKKITRFATLIIAILAFSINGTGQTYHNLASGSFSQDWTNTGLITTTDVWTGVPGIIGYRGDNISTATGVDPQTLVGEGTIVENVIANQTSPNTSTSGGVAEFEITDPVVAFQGSGTADAPNIIIFLTTTGTTNIQVQYNLRDIDGSADNAVQPVALQYRVGITGDFINIPAGFVADASSGPSLATLVTPVSVTLPVDAENQGQLQVRIITSNAGGSDEWIGIDDILITGTTGGNPVVSTPIFNPASGNYYSAQNVTISTTTEGASIYYTTDGSDPDNTDTEFTIPVSVSSTTTLKAIAYATGYDPSSIATAVYTFPTINDVVNIAALRAGLTDGTVYRLTGEAILTFKTAVRNAKYIQDATGAILIDDFTGKITTIYTVYDGITGITGTLNLYNGMLQFVPVTDPGAATSSGNLVTPVEVTLLNLNSDYQAKLVKVMSTTISETGDFAVATNYNLTDVSGTGILRTQYNDLDYIGTPIPSTPQDLTGVVLQYTTTTQLIPRGLTDFSASAGPAIVATPSEISGFSYAVGSGPSTSQSYELSGTGLTYPGQITITGSTNYEVSLDNSSFQPSASFLLNSSTLAPRTIFVRLKAGLSAGTYEGELVENSGGGILIPVNVTCNGSVYAPEPSNHVTNFMAGTTTATTIPLTWTDATGAVLPAGYLIKGSSVSYGAILDPADGTPESNDALVQNVSQGTETFTFSGLTPETPYYFKIYPYTNDGSAIDYKLGGVPEATATTLALPAGALLYENFDYPAGDNIGSNTTGVGGTNNNWTTHSNTTIATGTIDVIADNLTYTGLSASVGNKVLLPGDNLITPRDVNREIPGNTNTVMYFSALVQVIDNTQIKTTDDYFMSFGATSGNSVTSLGARLGIKSVNTAANYRLSILNTSGGTVSYTEFATDLEFGTTYLVVVKYDRSAIPTIASLWVNPASLGGTEPVGSVSNSSGTGTFAAFASICLRNTLNTPKAYIDEIRVGSTWADVTPSGMATKTLNLSSLFLEGIYAGAGTMRQAFGASGPQFDPGIADEITVELHNDATYSTIEYSATGVELSTTGTATVSGIPSTLNGNYYVTILHRNSIAITSASPVSFSDGTISYAFDSPLKVYENNLKTSDGYYLIYGGDVNQDGSADTGDFTPIENKANLFTVGYFPEDVNGDGSVDTGDYTIVENNASSFIYARHP